jgi:hypothetical protein
MVIIKKKTLSYFYTKREHSKKLVTKISVIALRTVIMLRQLNWPHVRIRDLLENYLYHSIAWTVDYKMSMERFFQCATHSQKNNEQIRHPQLFVHYLSSRYVIDFGHNFRMAHSNELIFSEIMGAAETHLPTKEQNF